MDNTSTGLNDGTAGYAERPRRCPPHRREGQTDAVSPVRRNGAVVPRLCQTLTNADCRCAAASSLEHLWMIALSQPRRAILPLTPRLLRLELRST